MERRIAAILAGDMVGYSRLIELDELGTLARQREHMLELIDPTIERMNGHIVKLTGDGLIAEFGSVIEAVQCAVAVQKEMAVRESDQPEDRRIQYRIAVNLGDVVFEDGDVFGDGVNIAARLEELAEPGGVVVSGTAYDLLKTNIDVGYRPLGERHLKNIATPVRVYQVTEDVNPWPSPVRTKSWVRIFAAAALALLSIMGITWYYWKTADIRSTSASALLNDEEPSIIVLPLDNLSEDPAQTYFANGLTEDITTDLSQMSGLFVISRNSAFTYADKSIDPRQISQELGVRYVLEGSVRRVAQTLRINVQLIDGQTGGHIWAKRYDGTPDDVLTFQDHVIENVVSSLQLHLDEDQKRQFNKAETNDPRAFDAFLKGWEHYLLRTPENFAAAIPYFKEAIAVDPNYGRAYAALASTYWEGWERWWYEPLGFEDWAGPRKEAERFLNEALKNPTALAHQVASEVRRQEGRLDEMVKEANEAVRLAPNDPNSYIAQVFALTLVGNAADALVAVDKAIALDPHFPAFHLYQKGFVHYTLRNYDEAAGYLEQSLKLNPANFSPNIFLVTSYARLGRLDEAKERFAVHPLPLSIDWMKFYYRYKNAEDWDHFADALRMVGVPEVAVKLPPPPEGG